MLSTTRVTDTAPLEEKFIVDRWREIAAFRQEDERDYYATTFHERDKETSWTT